jgi:serine/threonine protein kinase
LDEEGHIQVADFGLAKDNVTALDGARAICGTDPYIAPEMLTRGHYGYAADWWSFGIFVYELLTGLPPWNSENRNEMYYYIENAPIPLDHSHIAFSPEVRDLLSKLLIREPADRLGASPRCGTDIMAHPFFASINWGQLYARKINPPFLPVLDLSLKGKDDGSGASS